MNYRQLASLMRRREIMDIDDAATYLGIQKVSLEAACQRRTVGYVQVGSKKLFTREDLDEYMEKRAKGRFSNLAYKEPETIERLTPEEVGTL